MIIGNGDLASVLTDREDVVFMASGVSNSACTDINEYEREFELLMSIPRDKHIVYFSSLCVYYAKTMYSDHKRDVERFIQAHFQSYTVIRLGNIDWGKNPNTLINYLKAHPEAEIQNTYRHIVGKDEFLYWINLIRPGIKDIMNIPGRMVFVPDLAKVIREKVGDDVLINKAVGNRCRERYGVKGEINKLDRSLHEALNWPDGLKELCDTYGIPIELLSPNQPSTNNPPNNIDH